MSAADDIVARGHLDTTAREITDRAFRLDGPLVQNVARFLCVAEGLDPNSDVVGQDGPPFTLRNGNQVWFNVVAPVLRPLWMSYVDQARLAIASVDMARENLADNGDVASGRAELANLTVDAAFASEQAQLRSDGLNVG